MSQTYNKIPRDAKSLIDIGILTPRMLRPTNPSSPHSKIAINAIYTQQELSNNPELKDKVYKVLEFFQDTKKLGRDSNCKFSTRDWIVEALSKEVDRVREKMSSK